jgi:rhodanese-related sulfurtransferase
MRKIRLLAGVLAVSLMVMCPLACTSGANAPRLDQETLKGWLSDPQVIVLDVRQTHDWQSSDKKIKGAVRVNPNDIKTWAALLPKDKKIVLYCA